jgi:hypothetical protein
MRKEPLPVVIGHRYPLANKNLNIFRLMAPSKEVNNGGNRETGVFLAE